MPNEKQNNIRIESVKLDRFISDKVNQPKIKVKNNK